MILCAIVKNGRFDSAAGLVAACIKKDPGAWDYFVKKYSRLISISIQVRLAKYAMPLPCHEVEDIKQSVLASIWQDEKLRSVKDMRGISYWLSVVSGNAAIEYLRSKHGAKTPELVPLCVRVCESEPVEALRSCGPGPADELQTKEAMEKIEAAIGSLSGKEKLVAKMHIFYGKKRREIAECLNIPEGTVSSYLNRARKKLRKKLHQF